MELFFHSSRKIGEHNIMIKKSIFSKLFLIIEEEKETFDVSGKVPLGRNWSNSRVVQVMERIFRSSDPQCSHQMKACMRLFSISPFFRIIKLALLIKKKVSN